VVENDELTSYESGLKFRLIAYDIDVRPVVDDERVGIWEWIYPY
jgi:hypothetical protein